MQKTPISPHLAGRLARFLGVSAMALGLAACDKMKEPTVDQSKESGLEKTERAAAGPKGNAGKAAALPSECTEAVHCSST